MKFTIPSIAILIPAILSLLLLFSRRRKISTVIAISFITFDQIGAVLMGMKFGFLKVISISTLLGAGIVHKKLFLNKAFYLILCFFSIILLREFINSLIYNYPFLPFTLIYAQYLSIFAFASILLNRTAGDLKIFRKAVLLFFTINTIVILYELLSFRLGLPKFAVLSVNQLSSGLQGRLAAYEMGGELKWRAHSLMNEPKMLGACILIPLVFILGDKNFNYFNKTELKLIFVSVALGLYASASTSTFISLLGILLIFFSWKVIFDVSNAVIIVLKYIVPAICIFVIAFKDVIINLFLFRFYYRLFGNDAIVSDAFSGPFMPSELLLVNYLIENPFILLTGVGYGALFDIPELNVIGYPVPNIGFLYWLSLGGIWFIPIFFMTILSLSRNYFISLSSLIIIGSFAHIEAIAFLFVLSAVYGRSKRKMLSANL